MAPVIERTVVLTGARIECSKDAVVGRSDEHQPA
jgi:hypothetical protein